MVKNKVEGIVSDESLTTGLIGSIKHHCGKNKLRLIAYAGNPEAVAYRGELLENDLKTLNNALIEIKDIAKQNNYEEITKILEKRFYEEGV